MSYPDGSVNPIASGEEILESLENLKTSGQPFKFSELPQRTREDVKSGLKDPEGFSALKLDIVSILILISELLRSTTSGGDEMSILLTVSEASQDLWAIKIQNSKTEIVYR